MAESYRVCVHCGGDLGTALSAGSPMDDLQRSIDGGTTTQQRPPAQQQPYQQQPYQQQPYQQQPYQQQGPGQPSYSQPPPSYGQPPPPYGGQPYGGQPYPPPGYGPGPAYGYPPPFMYTPTYHPGLYDKPEREPYIDVGNLFKLLFRPKQAFEDLYDHTTSTQGSILAIMFIIISAVIGIMTTYGVLGTLDVPDDSAVPWVNSTNGAMSAVQVFINIMAFFLTAWLFHGLVKGRAAHPDQSKTIGMMGYAKFPAFLVLTIIGIATPLILLSSGFDASDPDTADEAIGSLCGLVVLVIGLGSVGFFWSIWVHTHAQSVANDVSTGTAFGYLFLSWIIIGIITAAISTVISLAFIAV
jgi:hypothetical protein